jgi:hypothetical protein
MAEREQPQVSVKQVEGHNENAENHEIGNSIHVHYRRQKQKKDGQNTDFFVYR